MNHGFAPLLARLRTPHKCVEPVLSPSYQKGDFDSHYVDCPFVFAHEGRFYMTYIGWDSIGYRTGLASSDDLIHWRKEGLIIDRGPQGSVNEFNVALTWILRDNDLFGDGHLKKVNGRFLGTYHSYPQPGYEIGSCAIGLCWSEDLRHWQLQEPFLHCSDGDDWERGGVFKSCLVEHDGTYFMFYNAKNKADAWNEQIGAAVSPDLKKWTRLKENPVLTNGPKGSFDATFAGDPCVLRIGDIWAMFYYGLSRPLVGHARDGVAFSRDLIHWEKSNEILIDVGPEGAIDSRFACKPAMFFKDGKLYHFYCATAPSDGKPTGQIEAHELRHEMRGIGLGVS